MTRRVAADNLFRSLDGSALSVGGHDWRVYVYGVFEERERRWVQVALAGARYSMVTLILAPTQGPRHAVRELSTWLRDPAATTNVLPHVA